MLKAQGLTKTYEDGTQALLDFNVEVRNGEVYALLGANGAGKTTALHLFLGFLAPTSGTAYVNGVDVTSAPQEAKKFVAYIPENVRLYESLTGLQNLDFFARLGQPTLPDPGTYADALRRVGLDERDWHRRVRHFSKGMRQKLALAIALVRRADNMLLDEPTAGLDPQAAADLMELLRRFRDEGRAILMATHEVFRVKAISDRVGILKAGRLIAEYTRSEFLHEDLEDLYLRYMTLEATVPPSGGPDLR
ncbi:MAG: ABC transporter ATP-binding protein [Acidobacteriota bacterium]|nr:ABC transporter ATP-binding protein [Acidobacteriota bacterium]